MSKPEYSVKQSYIPTEKYDHGIALCRDKTEHKYVLATAVVAFGYGLSKRRLCMQNDFLMLGSNEMVDNVGCRGVAAGVAKPLGANKTLDHRGWRMNTTIAI